MRGPDADEPVRMGPRGSKEHVRGDDADGSVGGALSPAFDHVHQLDQRVGRGGHLVADRPAGDLEELGRLRLAVHVGHQLGQRDDLLVDLEHPALDVRVVVEGETLDREDRAELLLLLLLGRPEGRVFLVEAGFVAGEALVSVRREG